MNDNILKHDYLTATEVSKYLNISLSKAYELTHRKDFPTCRFGGSIRIPREAFLSWVEQHTHIPTDLSVA
jgi:excisionase family DNA binding protein